MRCESGLRSLMTTATFSAPWANATAAAARLITAAIPIARHGRGISEAYSNGGWSPTSLENWPPTRAAEVSGAKRFCKSRAVTHEIGFAREVADRVLFLDGGVIAEEGPAAELLTNPRNPRTQDFLRRVLKPL